MNEKWAFDIDIHDIAYQSIINHCINRKGNVYE
jgi:hypothetical protein